MPDRTCSIDGCHQDASPYKGGARGWCKTHYMRWRRHGDPSHGGPVLRQTGTGHQCLVGECTDPVVALDLCNRHYRRLRKHGDPTAGGPKPGTVSTEDRFWSKVDKTDGCWLWTDAPNGNGYGTFKANGVSEMAHRYSLKLTGQQLTDGLTIDHLCRVRLCVNPAHLEEVTYAENLLRAARAGSGVAAPVGTGHPQP